MLTISYTVKQKHLWLTNKTAQVPILFVQVSKIYFGAKIFGVMNGNEDTRFENL